MGAYFDFRMHTAYGRVASLIALSSAAWSADDVISITVVSKCRESLASRAKSVHDLTGVDLPGVNGFFMASKVPGWPRTRNMARMPEGDVMNCSSSRSGSRSAGLMFAATSLLFTMACGADVPAKPEAAAAVSKAITSTLTRTVRSATYCQTVQADFSFVSMGQVDLVEMFQNLIDKRPLNDAAAAGVVKVELKEFRVAPGGRSPDPSCDALHAQYIQGGAGGPVRFAVVRTTLTPKGTAAGVEFDKPIEVATRELVDVIDVRPERGGLTAVKYTWTWTPTTMAETIGYTLAASQEATARLRHSDGGWVVEDTGVKR